MRDKLAHWPTQAGLLPLISPDWLLYPVLEAVQSIGDLMNGKYIVNTLTVLSNQLYVFIGRNFLS